MIQLHYYIFSFSPQIKKNLLEWGVSTLGDQWHRHEEQINKKRKVERSSTNKTVSAKLNSNAIYMKMFLRELKEKNRPTKL